MKNMILLLSDPLLLKLLTQDLEKADAKFKVPLTSYHVTPILEHCKVSSLSYALSHNSTFHNMINIHLAVL